VGKGNSGNVARRHAWSSRESFDKDNFINSCSFRRTRSSRVENGMPVACFTSEWRIIMRCDRGITIVSLPHVWKRFLNVHRTKHHWVCNSKKVVIIRIHQYLLLYERVSTHHWMVKIGLDSRAHFITTPIWQVLSKSPQWSTVLMA
jgi:hypothetical protein